ncbi:MAG TPA: DEAD/DEAH box helicase [Polyangiaceae bacterium]|nr:DEAD/DEAH box helicase [Polyangiaceae bacterium]
MPVPLSSTSFSSPASTSAQVLCVPHVRLFADRVVVTSTDGLSEAHDEALAPLIELSFEYGGTKVRSSDERMRIFRADGHGLETLERNRAAEMEARRVLERLGGIDLACVDVVTPPEGCEADYVVRTDGDTHSFCAFTTRALGAWRALGWRVDVDPGYPFRVVESEPEWYARIEPCDEPVGAPTDWFGLELGVEIGGSRVNLLPVLLDLIEQLDGGLDALSASCRPTWALRVNETHHVTVPLDRLRVLLRVVGELYQGEHRRAKAFPESRAAALVELDEAFASAGAPIRWTDRSRVTERARARIAPLAVPAAPTGLRATLRPYQAEGVAFLQRLRTDEAGGILADEMGLGKTLQTIAHICVERAEGRLDAPVLVVGPTTLVGNWSRELAKFAPDLRVVVLHGTERRARWAEVPAAHVVVTTYPVLVRDEERFAEQRFHMAVLDEAQAIKNARSQARRALASLNVKHRLCLTGTPVENHLGELWSIVDWLVPGLLGGELAFRRFWQKPIEARGDAERLLALRAVAAPYVLRRLKSDVAKELPPKTELSVPVELGGKQRDLYEAIRVAAHADVRKAIRVKGLGASTLMILDALTKLRQICCDPRLLAMDAARSVRESAKFDALMALVETQLQGRHRILIFSQFTSMLALVAEGLRARGVEPLSLTGATRERQRVVDAFEEGRSDVFLISLKAGGTGLNLTSADTVIHYDPWWNPAAQAQATDRAYRIGQKRPVFVHNLYVAGSVEERVLALQDKKRWLSTGLLGDGGAASPLNEGEIDALFAPIASSAEPS